MLKIIILSLIFSLGIFSGLGVVPCISANDDVGTKSKQPLVTRIEGIEGELSKLDPAKQNSPEVKALKGDIFDYKKKLAKLPELISEDKEKDNNEFINIYINI